MLSVAHCTDGVATSIVSRSQKVFMSYPQGIPIVYQIHFLLNFNTSALSFDYQMVSTDLFEITLLHDFTHHFDQITCSLLKQCTKAVKQPLYHGALLEKRQLQIAFFFTGT